jgi:non-ribosomal peptide synthetase component F
MVLLAGYQLMLYWLCCQPDFVIACPIANRTRTETEHLIGFFVNTLAIRARINPGSTSRDLLQTVRGAMLAAYAHQDFPFERLVEQIRPERQLGVTPLCRVLFVLQNVPSLSVGLDTLTLEPLEIESRTTRFDLELILSEHAGSLGGKLVYRTALFTPTTVARMMNGFLAALEELASETGGTIADIGRRLQEAENARERHSQNALRNLAVSTLQQAIRRTASKHSA